MIFNGTHQHHACMHEYCDSRPLTSQLHIFGPWSEQAADESENFDQTVTITIRNVKVMITITNKSESDDHITAVHLSAASALPMVKAAKAEGLPLTVETCHHYLRSF